MEVLLYRPQACGIENRFISIFTRDDGYKIGCRCRFEKDIACSEIDQKVLEEWKASALTEETMREQNPESVAAALNNSADAENLDTLFVVNVYNSTAIWHVAVLLKVNNRWYSFGGWPKEDLGLYGKKLFSLVSSIVPGLNSSFTVCFPDALLGMNHYMYQYKGRRTRFSMQVLAKMSLNETIYNRFVDPDEDLWGSICRESELFNFGTSNDGMTLRTYLIEHLKTLNQQTLLRNNIMIDKLKELVDGRQATPTPVAS